MSHLSPDELIDIMEGVLAPARQAHLTECEVCRRELAGLSSVLSDAKQSSVPEPSPLFWKHFSARVSEAIDHDATRDGIWPAWMRWQVLAPIGVVAMIILALMIAVPKQDADPIGALDVPVAMDTPDAIDTLAAVVGDLDLETASAAGVIEPGAAEQAVLHLTAEEQQELTRLLKAELLRAKS